MSKTTQFHKENVFLESYRQQFSVIRQFKALKQVVNFTSTSKNYDTTKIYVDIILWNVLMTTIRVKM